MANEEPIVDRRNNHCPNTKIPKNIHPATVLPITNEIKTKIDKLLTHFIGNNSKPKVKSVEAFHKIN